MARSSSSHRWLREHHRDRFVQQARDAGYRSRAAFKLLQLQEKDRLLSPGQVVVDLGAAPGGWSQVAAGLTGPSGRVLALDLLEMEPLEGVEFIQGDFTGDEALHRLLVLLDGQRVDIVLSDMAPNMSGVRQVDQPRAMYLCELAADFAATVLAPGGDLVMKVFMGEGFDELVRNLRRDYERVHTRKPEASRSRSPECYLLARGWRGG
ncbi:MAG: 23S rRNA (uridine(2552)-2'-O)-methyltransferase RlmE [Gammaproteobacteria bacterium]|nr:MAG: 23S rRNA (uridine(2552)-2'-O)-methyltransferase RlmE [Gammaproteobacteria bacterium]